MTGIANSSIQPWLDFRFSEIPTSIPSCQFHQPDNSIGLTNCTTICNDTTSFEQQLLPNNLLTCGLWSTLTVLDSYHDVAVYYNETYPQLDPSLLQRFDFLGLDSSDKAYSYAAVNAISTYLSALQLLVKLPAIQDEEGLYGPCNEQTLFPRQPLNTSGGLSENLVDCVDFICSPRTLDQDLGGIGVSLFCRIIRH